MGYDWLLAALIGGLVIIGLLAYYYVYRFRNEPLE